MIPILLLLAAGGLMHTARGFITVPTSATVQLAFGFLLLCAYFTARVVSQLGLPKLTGYMIAGVLSGPFVFDLVSSDMTGSLAIVNSTATAIIALEAGAELQLANVRRMSRTIAAITFFAVMGAMLFIAATIVGLQPLLPFLQGLSTAELLAVALVLGVVLAAQSPAVVMALLAELRAKGPVSELMLASVVVADLIVIVCFSIASAVTSAVIGGGVDPLSTVRDVSWELFGSMGLGVVIGMLIALYLRTVRDGAQLFALTICVVVAEAGPRMHLDPLIVMLGAGLWIRNAPRTDPASLLSGFESAQLPVFLVFFALAGAKLDLATLGTMLIPVTIISIARAGSFYAGSKVALRGRSSDTAGMQHVWVGLMPQAGLALALALVLEKTFPTFGGPASVIVLGVVGLNQLVGPVILRIVLLRTGEVGKKDPLDTSAH